MRRPWPALGRSATQKNDDNDNDVDNSINNDFY